MKRKSCIMLIGILIMLMLPLNNIVNADSTGFSDATTDNLDDYRPIDIGEENTLVEKGNVVIGALRIVGSVVSVITIMIIGFRYMIGSVDEKADYKKTMRPWLIGAIILLFVTVIPNVIYQIATSF